MCHAAAALGTYNSFVGGYPKSDGLTFCSMAEIGI